MSLDTINKSFIATTFNLKPDKRAEQEVQFWLNDGERGDKFKHTIFQIVRIGLWVVGIIMLAIIIVLAWHFLTPKCWRWLSPDELHNLERILFSSVILSLAGKYFKKYGIVD